MDPMPKPLFATISKGVAAEVEAEREEEEEEEEARGKEMHHGSTPITRTKSEVAPQSSKRHRSPPPSPRLRSCSSEAMAMLTTSTSVSASAPRRRRRTKNSVEVPQAAEENVSLSHRRRSRRISARRSKAISSQDYALQEGFNHEEEEDEEEEETEEEEEQEEEQENIEIGGRNRVKRKSIAKNKILGNNLSTQPPSLDDHSIQGKETIPHSAKQIPPPPQVHTFAYRATRSSTISSSALPRPPPSQQRHDQESRVLLEGLDWLQCVVDVIMWKHFPRSAFLFGLGCFCIMSASVIQDMKYSVISAIAYVALIYLAVTFTKHTIRRSGTLPSDAPSYAYVVTEAEALRLIRVLLPPINLMLIKLGELFSGEPTVTLKVAAALWFFAQIGSLMNVWTLARIAYLALFTVPKCYSCYSDQVHAQVRNILNWFWGTWGACTHKKVVLFSAFFIAWNLSSISTRVCGAFMALVAVRAYQHVIRRELEVGSNLLNQDGLGGINNERSSRIPSGPSEGRRQWRMS